VKRFLADFRVVSHDHLLVIWVLAIYALVIALFFGFVGCMSSYDGLMGFAALISLVWAIWASFPPKEE
jgi:hypothetical protein